MVLSYVRQHGTINRGDVIELCKIGPDQATRLLKQLTERGILSKHGTKRGTWYEPGDEV